MLIFFFFSKKKITEATLTFQESLHYFQYLKSAVPSVLCPSVLDLITCSDLRNSS